VNEPAPRITVFQRALYRVRGRSVELAEQPPKPVQRARPLRVARMLALAHKAEQLLAEGVVESQAELAHCLGFTPARVSQLLDLTLLAPDLQERLLFAETTEGRDPITERDLRRILRHVLWADQRRALEEQDVVG
jgi:hypothetical protein